VNRIVTSLLATLALAFFACVPRPSQAAQSYAGCTGIIDSVPAVIDTPGTWCLKQDLATSINSGMAITLAADGITLDCNGFAIDGRAGGNESTSYGIFAQNRRRAIIRHCHIQGFLYGVLLTQDNGTDSLRVGHVIEGNYLEATTSTGLHIEGAGSVVRSNRVANIGGSTINGFHIGIETWYSVDVLDNTISGVASKTAKSASGIYAYRNANGTISGNRVRDIQAGGESMGFVGAGWGISLTGNGRATIRSNDLSVIPDANASIYTNGVECDSPSARASDNVINGFATSLRGCSDAGGNDFTP